MRHIYIFPQGIPFKQPPHQRIVGLDEYLSGISGMPDSGDYDVFEDWTSNFEDLKHWSSEEYTDGKTVGGVKKAIETTMGRLNDAGYKTRELTDKDEESATTPSWLFGHAPGPGWTVNLADEERIPCLMFHLTNLYALLEGLPAESHLHLEEI